MSHVALPHHGHRFPPVVIQHVVWLYLRFTLSLRDVEDMLVHRLRRKVHLPSEMNRCTASKLVGRLLQTDESSVWVGPLAERGLDLSYETVRRWVCKFGPLFARDLRRRRPRPTARWHLDEMLITIAGKRHWLWRAVDDEGEVLDVLGRRDGTPGPPSGSCVNSLESTALCPR